MFNSTRHTPRGWRLVFLVQFSARRLWVPEPPTRGPGHSGAGTPGLPRPRPLGDPGLPRPRPPGVRRSPSPRPWLLSVLTSFPFWLQLSERAGAGGSGKGGRAREPDGGVRGGAEKLRRGLDRGPETDGNGGPGPTLPPPLPSRSEPEHPVTLPAPVTDDPFSPGLPQGLPQGPSLSRPPTLGLRQGSRPVT